MQGACPPSSTKYLSIALAITIAFFAIELIGGILTNSLALMSDAWHMLNDAFGLAFAIFAAWISSRPTNIRKTYGYYRTEIIAAFLNGLFLWGIVVYIFFEAIQRIQQPTEVKSLTMLIIAFFGLLANGLSALTLSKSKDSSLNVKGAFLHVVADTLGSFGAISAGVIMLLTGWYQADAVISMMIGVLIFYSSGKLIFEALNILLEGVPHDIDISVLEKRISKMEGIKSVHDLHVWCIAPNKTCCMSCHIIVEKEVDRKELITDLINILKKEFGVDHTTFQLEDEDYPKAANEH
jgi:cobalt-zinc-cadmium efflux system protein